MTRLEGIATGGATTRRRFLTRGVGVGAGMYFAGALAACGADDSGSAGSPGKADMPWLTWSDHYVPGQLEKVAQQTGITAQPTLIEGSSASTLEKVRRAGGQFGMVSADALWVPKYVADGATASFDVGSIGASQELYPIALDYDVWKAGSEYMAFPFSWATQPTYYNPKYVSPAPESYEALLSSKYRKRITLVNDPIYVFALAGLAIGAESPFSMTPDQVAQAKDYLIELKPNVLHFVNQQQEALRVLANESAWIGPGNNLGTDLLVKEINENVELDVIVPREGAIGFVDGELPVKEADNADAFARWIDVACRADWAAKNFLANPRPLFNEKAYKLLVDQGHKEEADRAFFNEPERAYDQVLNGPADDAQAYTDAFNEVFGG